MPAGGGGGGEGGIVVARGANMDFCFVVFYLVEQKLEDSVVVVKTVPSKLTNSDPFGPITPAENVDTLPSPEVLWGREDLMDFSESPVVSSGNNSEITIGLSLDPLNCQCLIPIDSSTPWQNEHAESSLHDSSLSVEF